MTNPTIGYSPKLRRPATLDHLKKKEPLQKVAEVVLSDAPVEALKAAEQRLYEALTDKERKVAQEAVNEAKAALEEATVEVLFRSIGRVAYDALLDAYPPTTEQREKAEKQKKGMGEELIWNDDTFPIALIAASAVEPKMTEEDVKELYDTWNSNEIAPLFFAALEVNTQRRTSSLGKDYGGTTA